jgi:putative membrane protein
VTIALRFVGLLVGIAVLAWLVAHADLAELLAVFPQIGWGFLAILAVRAVTIGINAAAWRCLVSRRDRPSFATFAVLRWIGEAINTTLPVAQIGGDVARARLLQQRLTTPAHAAAAGAVDFCVTIFAEFLFTVLGFALLARLGGAGWWPIAASMALLLIFVWFSRELLFRRRLLAVAHQGLLRLGRSRLVASVVALDVALRDVADGPAPLIRSLLLHLLAFTGQCLETWLTLSLMGAPTDFAAAVMLESLSFAARSAAFLIPGGWGAQEASLVALAAAGGLSPDAALALGLVKRAREFAVGVPGLLAWGVAERRGMVRSRG